MWHKYTDFETHNVQFGISIKDYQIKSNTNIYIYYWWKNKKENLRNARHFSHHPGQTFHIS